MPRGPTPLAPVVLTLEGTSWSAATIDALSAMEHHFRAGGIQGDAHTIVVDPSPGLRYGIPDRRRETAKASGN